MLIHSQKSNRLLTRFLFVLVVIAVISTILVPVVFAATWSASAVLPKSN
jgi:cell division protein FtsN